MGNMSYCIFENTFKDLQDCYKVLSEEEFSDLSKLEQRYAKKLISLCSDISQDFDETLNED